MTILTIIQARMRSSRLPGKVLAPLGDATLLEWVVRAAHRSQIGDVVVATSTEGDDDAIAEVAHRLSIRCVRGSEDDVLGRFVHALEVYPAEAFVRLTADCPLLDPAVIRMTVGAFEAGDVDYVSTTLQRTLPRGLDVEVCSSEALLRAHANAGGADRSHVTSWLYRSPGNARVAGVVFEPRADDLRVTVDTAEDLTLVRRIVDILADAASSRDALIDLLRQRPDLVGLNAGVRQKDLWEG